MPRWVTDKVGRWYPAREKVSLVNHKKESITNPSANWSSHYQEVVGPGEPYIYEGPDRAALEQLYNEGVDHLGNDFHNDPELISRVKQMGYKNVEEFAKVMGWDEKKAQEKFEKLSGVIMSHEVTEKKEAVNKLGGGQDLTGQGNDTYGGFGEPPLR